MKRTITEWNIACYTHTHLIFHLMSSSTLIDPPLCCSTWPLWAFSLWSSRGRHRARQPTNWWTPWRTRTSCTGSTVCRSWSRSASLRRRPSGGCTARGESLQPAAGHLTRRQFCCVLKADGSSQLDFSSVTEHQLCETRSLWVGKVRTVL